MSCRGDFVSLTFVDLGRQPIHSQESILSRMDPTATNTMDSEGNSCAVIFYAGWCLQNMLGVAL